MESRWISFINRLSAEGAQRAAVLFRILESLYRHPPRAYHNLDHVRNLLQVFDALKAEAQNPEAVEFAIWMHDCIYVPGRSDNEELSADAACVFLSSLNCNESFKCAVRDNVLATKHDKPGANRDACLTADIDLSVLAIPPKDYRENSGKIRTEFSHVDDSTFDAGRREFIETFLGKSSIYQTNRCRAMYESKARANLVEERGTLST
ncbi:MAG: hypothetical protein IPK83_21045 [Planctomycetes bacterium]|nr:hypothetical protein [Planctomycetota bacterium]